MEEQRRESRIAGRFFGIVSAAVLVLDIVLLTCACYATTFLRPQFVRLFADFDAELPVLTQWILCVPNALFVATFLGVGILLVLKEIAVQNAAVNLALNAIAALSLCAFGAVFWTALVLPLDRILLRLS